MSSKTLLFLLVLPLLATACTAPSQKASANAITHWEDVPIPQGFEPVTTRATEATLEVGEFRHGDLRYQGLGNIETVQRYFMDRLPLHGWEMDLQASCWRNGPSRLEVAVNYADKSSSEAFQKIWIDLRMRSERPPLRSR